MKNFHKWNSELQSDQQIPRELEHLGEMVWDACAVECAKLCRKALEDLGDEIEDH